MKKVIKEFEAIILFIFSFIPGILGFKLRGLLYKQYFISKNYVNISQFCKFIKPRSIYFGEKVVIGDRAFFTSDGGEIIIGSNTSFNVNVHINASVAGRIIIGKDCLIGPNVVMRTADHIFSNPNKNIREQGHVANDITIDDDVWLGSNVIIVGGVSIGKGSVIGAGAVVTKSIPPYSVAVGIPAVVIKKRNIN
jgi:acetyltransferase-like isoleucine patch superfamily enzyme